MYSVYNMIIARITDYNGLSLNVNMPCGRHVKSAQDANFAQVLLIGIY